VELTTEDPVWRETLAANRDLLESICMVSEVKFADHPSEGAAPGHTIKHVSIRGYRSPHPRCERCWNHRPTVGRYAAHPALCDRCARVVGGTA
jgi:isoleucyl-tRNA synthetase